MYNTMPMRATDTQSNESTSARP